MNRIEPLDWQRGLLAFAIMLYHLTSWQLSTLDASSLLGRLGIYGVSMFFVLSGLSMALVYSRYINSVRTSIAFFIRRIFRIWPLLWVAVGFSVAATLAAGKTPNWFAVMMNLTTAFGFTDTSLFISTGAWSIGNEMVYYAMTPLIIYAFNKRVFLGNVLTAAAILIGLIFSSHLLNASSSLAAQWATYINPFNNLFLYCAGIAIYYNARSWQLSTITSFSCFVVPFLIFIFYPAQGDQINIVTGYSRIAFCAASIALVLAFYKNAFSIPQAISILLTHLGVLTYGVYLLHPKVYGVIVLVSKKLHFQLGAYTVIALTMLFTIILAQTLFKLLEEPFIRIGKKLTAMPSAGGPRPDEVVSGGDQAVTSR